LRINDDDIEYDDADRPTYDGHLFTGTVVEYFRDGSVATEVDFLNGLRHGLTRLYSTDGKLASEVRFTEGARQGLSREWYGNGTLKSEATYGADPRPDSLLEVREWDDDGHEITTRTSGD
jgi:antitoxin component YwqK of YwqJK toxin-antitoxin module